MSFEELVNLIRRLNPGVEIRVGDPTKDKDATSRIFSSEAGCNLRLPEGFEYNNNGINNRHHNIMGQKSIMIDVELLAKANEEMLLPKGEVNIHEVVQNTCPTSPDEIRRVRNVAVGAINSLYHKVRDGKRKGM